MEQKLRSTLSPRTAWILIGVCVIFWIISAFGLLQLPTSAPSLLTFFWLYLNALAALTSAVAVAAAVAALVLHRRAALALEPERPGGGPSSAPDDGGETDGEETDLFRLLDENPEPEKTTRPARKKRKRG
ncbi:hypothetical protein H9639_05745 [Arthrobacter sp. Sa2CUA1]|uniref:Uncharacterized protein n=1 Tax=Arthrobacter gallicola TaxID=2762225 RepID=A0ABR8UQH7_9MICC|nr:hypothetical protein [Arthrobacter gallicola]MBD7994798.1 hypothetical protein [Arthrobacter gallicola]